MNNIFHNKKGLILSEVMLAIVLMSIAVVVVGGIINTSIKTASFSRNFVSAELLVNEGIEAVTNIRDTNWLRHPENHNCWLIKNPSGDDPCPLTGNPNETALENTNYLLTFDNMAWSLSNEGLAPGDFDPDNPDEAYRLYLDDYLGVNFYRDASSKGENATPTQYYRHVIFNEIKAESAAITVTVAWREGAKERNISRKFKLYNY